MRTILPLSGLRGCLALQATLLLALLLPGSLRSEEAVPDGNRGKPGNRALLEKVDIAYADADELQTLDVFAPREARGLPVVLMAHGGGWTIGDKNLFGRYRNVGRTLARHGVVAVMVNYRLSPKVRHPEHARDVARAFAWVRRHVREYGGDPDRIVLAGHSAGAHLVSLLAVDPSFFQDKELKLTERDRAAVRGVIAISGIYRIPTTEEWRKIAESLVGQVVQVSGHNAVVSALSPLMLETLYVVNPFQLAFGEDREVRMQAAPLNHVRKGLPPFLVMHAERDLPGLSGMAREFHEALRMADCSSELCMIAGGNHNTILFQFNRPSEPTVQAMLRFLNGVLRARCRGPLLDGRRPHRGPARSVADRGAARRQCPHLPDRLAVGPPGRRPGGAAHRGHRLAARQSRGRRPGGRGPALARPGLGRRTDRPDRTAGAVPRCADSAPGTGTGVSLHLHALRRGERQQRPHLEHEGPIYPGTCAGRRVAAADLGEQPYCWRFRLTGESPSFEDCFRGLTQLDLRALGGDFVVWKSPRGQTPATPAYQLAVVVDDAAQGVTEVIRGDDLVPSTPRQLLLYQALRLTPPRFSHVPLVVGPDGRRLAKRHGDTRLSALRQAGVKAEALLGLLAWSCGWIEGREPISARELVPLFRLEAIPPGPFVLTPELLAGIGYREPGQTRRTTRDR